jgi:hypothetical protein
MNNGNNNPNTHMVAQISYFFRLSLVFYCPHPQKDRQMGIKKNNEMHWKSEPTVSNTLLVNTLLVKINDERKLLLLYLIATLQSSKLNICFSSNKIYKTPL